MKKKIAILGSTSSIGKSLLNIIKKDKKNFKIELLTANTNYKDLINQAKQFEVKNLVITDSKSFEKSKKFYKGKKINIFKNFENLKFILPKKVDYVMSAISGIGGLSPTYKIIKHTKKIAIANKETIICGWDLIYKELNKYKTNFIPVDSEHFSIWSLLQEHTSNDIEKIYITASGGPFLTLPKKNFSKISIKKALKHPNWNMGKKITIDSATLMNKVFEVIEAKNIFNLPYKKISILTHPDSYIHTIIKFKNGLIKILAHEPDMKIPIFNSLYDKKFRSMNTKPINIKILNNLSLENVDTKKFSFVKILEKMSKYSSLFETVLITVNDYFVHRFLKKDISFEKMIFLINKFVNHKKFRSMNTKPINIKILNNLSLENVDTKKFSFVKILENMSKYSSLFETILITVNDYFVHKFLKKDISFEKMIFLINKFVNLKKFQKYKKIKPKNVKDIYRLRDYVSSKMDSLGI